MSRLGTLLTALSLLGVSSAETANRQAGMGFLDPLCISAVSASSGYATAVETGATTSSRVRCEKTSGVVALPSLPGLPSFPPTTYGPVVRKVLTTCESGLVKQVIQDCATTDTTCTGTCNNTQVHFYSEGEYNKKYSGQCSANNGSAWNATANDWLWTPASATMTGKSTVYQVAFGQSHEAVNPCTGQVVAPATGVPQRTAQVGFPSCSSAGGQAAFIQTGTMLPVGATAGSSVGGSFCYNMASCGSQGCESPVTEKTYECIDDAGNIHGTIDRCADAACASCPVDYSKRQTYMHSQSDIAKMMAGNCSVVQQYDPSYQTLYYNGFRYPAWLTQVATNFTAYPQCTSNAPASFPADCALATACNGALAGDTSSKNYYCAKSSGGGLAKSCSTRGSSCSAYGLGACAPDATFTSAKCLTAADINQGLNTCGSSLAAAGKVELTSAALLGMTAATAAMLLA